MTDSQISGVDGGAAPGKPAASNKAHAYVQRAVEIRSQPSQRLLAYGMYPATQRLLWLETWIMNDHPERAKPLRTAYAQSLVSLREQLVEALREVQGQWASAEQALSQAVADLPVIETVTVKLRTPLASLYLDVLMKLDGLLSAFTVMLQSGQINKRAWQQGGKPWIHSLWDLTKQIQSEMDVVREELDPVRAKFEREQALLKIRPQTPGVQRSISTRSEEQYPVDSEGGAHGL